MAASVVTHTPSSLNCVTDGEGERDLEEEEEEEERGREEVGSVPPQVKLCHLSCQPVETVREGSSDSASVAMVAVDVPSARAENHKPSECAPKEAINITPRVEEPAESTTAPDKELKMQDPMNKWPSDSTELGGRTHAPPPVEPVPSHEPNEEEEQTEGEEAEDEDLIAPVELKIEFLRAVMDKDLELAHRLCQMILIHEPDNPEASGFLPLIKKKLLEEQEAEQSNEEEDDEEDSDDDDDDDDDNSSGSDEESSQSSSCSSSSCSSSSPSDDDGEKEERQVNRHKPCPPSHISPESVELIQQWCRCWRFCQHTSVLQACY
ncbi:hypothetical protein INR49_000329 [Caranx melampygus]|nr:hypothetical protein INR49_000329 [Caranx melampygus]